MKNHPIKRLEGFEGFNQGDVPSRIPDTNLVECLNAQCDRTGRISKSRGTYPVTMADALGVTTIKAKNHAGGRNRSKAQGGRQRALCVVGNQILRSGPNNIYDAFTPIAFPAEIETPALNRVAALAFKDDYGYHQNGVDVPFRVQMETEDGSVPSATAEILGLRPPMYFNSGATGGAAGTRFVDGRTHAYAITFVYGTRGESGPSPIQPYEASSDLDTIVFSDLPLGPSGCTAKRIYRTRIGGANNLLVGAGAIDFPPSVELFFVQEIDDSTTTWTDEFDDSGLDFGRRCPPPRPFPPRSYYQVIHQDHVVWANLRDHPWTIGFVDDPDDTDTSPTITIDNTGNGTITLTNSGGSLTISDYKTKSLATIRAAVMGTFNLALGFAISSTGFICRVAPGVDADRTYRFAEVTAQSIDTNANVYWAEAIDDSTDAVVVDGSEYFPSDVMFSNTAFVEEINPLNRFTINKNDAYPITNLGVDNYTVAVLTRRNIWLLTGSLSTDPETFEPDFSIASVNSWSGSICTRPDAICQTPNGLVFVGEDGLRLLSGGASRRMAPEIDPRLLRRIRIEPRARENVSLYWWNGTIWIAYPGEEVA